ncbi:hypothetical protein ACLOJK_000262 [Asimina triloba]
MIAPLMVGCDLKREGKTSVPSDNNSVDRRAVPLTENQWGSTEVPLDETTTNERKDEACSPIDVSTDDRRTMIHRSIDGASTEVVTGSYGDARGVRENAQKVDLTRFGIKIRKDLEAKRF